MPNNEFNSPQNGPVEKSEKGFPATPNTVCELAVEVKIPINEVFISLNLPGELFKAEFRSTQAL